MPPGPLAERLLEALAPGGAWFFHQLARTMAADSEATPSDADLSAALWELVWSGRVQQRHPAAVAGADPFRHAVAPLPPATAARPRRALHRRCADAGPSRSSGDGRPMDDPARARFRPDQARPRGGRSGSWTATVWSPAGRSSPSAPPEGSPPSTRCSARFEESGRARRGYFVEGLGAAQFGTAGSVDRLRTFSRVEPADKPVALALAATDPANPYGAALPWPAAEEGHRPGRKAGAIVVLVDGELAMYVERGGRTLLTWSEEPNLLEPGAEALAEAVRRGALGRLTVEKARRRPAARLGRHPAAPGAPVRRLRRHPARPAPDLAEQVRSCPRVTRCSGPPGGSTRGWRGRCSRVRTSGCRSWPRRTCPAAPCERR